MNWTYSDLNEFKRQLASDAEMRQAFDRRRANMGRSSTDPNSTFGTDFVHGMGRGAVAATLGLPGDVERLVRGGVGLAGGLEGAIQGLSADTALYNTDDILKKLYDVQRTPGMEGGELVGQLFNMPLSSLVGLKYLRALLKSRAAKAAATAGTMGAVGVASAGAKALGYAEGGAVQAEHNSDDLDDLLDAAYMNVQLSTE